MRNTVLRLLMVSVLSLLGVSAWAHAFLSQSVPAVGGIVPAAPRRSGSTFTEGMFPSRRSRGSSCHRGWTAGRHRTRDGSHLCDNTQLVLALPPLPPGRYRVRWRVVSVETATRPKAITPSRSGRDGGLWMTP